MKTTIFFFSGTGNSLKIAKDLAKKLEDIELIPIAKIWEKENFRVKSEKIGFIFPLHYYGLPKIVFDFISRLDLRKSNYFFTIITYAGDINEEPLQQIERLLKAKGKTLNAGFFILMPNNYIIGYDIHPQELQKELFEKAIEEIELISDFIKYDKENLNSAIFKKDVSRSERINNEFRKNVYKSDKSFYVDNNCNGCSICEEICPVNNIIILEGKPYWQHKCHQCLACINFCPVKAIQFGKETLKTQRYHHPEITIQDMISQKK